MEKPQLTLGLYRHYRGGLYIATSVALHTETKEWMVHYMDIFTLETYIRPYELFVGDAPEIKTKRFQRVQNMGQLIKWSQS